MFEDVKESMKKMIKEMDKQMNQMKLGELENTISRKNRVNEITIRLDTAEDQ